MTAPVLPEGRWQGLWSPPPLERLVDGYAVAAAISGATSPLTDYAHVARAVLPFLAWQNRAFAYNPSSIASLQRSALAGARELNCLVGTERALDLLAEALFTKITLRYLAETYEGTPYLRHKNVDVDIEHPPGEPLTAYLQEFMRHAITLALPYTLELRRMNIISVITWTEKEYVTTRGFARGWIVDGEQWP